MEKPVLNVNARKPETGRWVKSIVKKLEKFDQIEVRALGSAISLALYAVNTAAEKNLCEVVKIESALVRGKFKHSPSICFLVKKRSQPRGAWGRK